MGHVLSTGACVRVNNCVCRPAGLKDTHFVSFRSLSLWCPARLSQDYAQLGILKRHFPTVPVLAVTATASEHVRRDVCNILGLQPHNTRVFRSTANRPNLRYAVRPKPDGTNAVTADMAAYIQHFHAANSGIIYTLSRKEADTVATSLNREYGITARAYHSDVSATTKERVQNQWMQGKVQVVVATIAFGLGINKPNVRFVLHHCISKNLDSYYQESGRAGRDGEPADCVLYYSPRVSVVSIHLVRYLFAWIL